MVKLDKIYTGGGDKGLTSLGDGRRVSKSSLRIQAQGDVDETNAAIGLARCHVRSAGSNDILARVQNDLFDLGADICRPDTGGAGLRIVAAQVIRLEGEIDSVNADLLPLSSFVLRGGSNFAAALHFACTVCRRAERSVCAVADVEEVNPQVLKYLNRLSDLLFVLAREANDGGQSDVLWEPGRHGGKANPCGS